MLQLSSYVNILNNAADAVLFNIEADGGKIHLNIEKVHSINLLVVLKTMVKVFRTILKNVFLMCFIQERR